MHKPKVSKAAWRGTRGSAWAVDYRDHGGKRHRRFFPTKAEAQAWAETFSIKAANEGIRSALLPEEVRVMAMKAAELLEPFGVTVLDAAKFYVSHHETITPKSVGDAVNELLALKQAREASARYLGDLRSRLSRFANDFPCDIGDVTTGQVQEYLDGLHLAQQSYVNFRRVLNLLFSYAKARRHCAENPIEGIERVKVRNGEILIFTPEEMAKLLETCPADFLACLAIGAFAGLRSAEIERLDWSDIDLAGRHIVIGAAKAKTASRRIVPMHPNLSAWLAPYAQRQGRIWTGTHDAYYDAQRELAEAAGVEWKANGLRHSYASYRFAQIGDAGRVAGELGNSAVVVHRHYRELVKPVDAQAWFSILPNRPANVISARPA